MVGPLGWLRDIPTFGEYVLIHQDKVHIEHHVRDDEGRWLLTERKDMQASLPFASISIAIALPRVYERVDWLIG